MEYRSQIKPRFGTPLDLKHWSNKGLVAGYAMNEFGGDKIFAVSEGSALPSPVNAGTLVNMAPMSPTSGWVPGPHGAALAMDNINDYVACGTGLSLDLTTAFTLISIVTPTSFNAYAGLFRKGNWRYSLEIQETGNLWAYVNNAQTLRSDTVLTINNTYKLAWTHQAAGDKLYIDGKLDKQGDLPDPISAPTELVTIGCLSGGGYGQKGIHHGVDVYNRAWQLDEIAYKAAFPWCGYEDEKGMQEWLWQKNIAVLDNYYRQMRAA